MARDKEIRPEHRGCVCCELPLEPGVPDKCECPNHEGAK